MTHPPSQTLKSLTSLRFFAAMWVVCFHYWPDLSQSMPGIVSKGYLAVDFFFVLSGFILSHVYLERYRDGAFTYREFISARFARIYPLHIATLLALLILVLGLALFGIHAGDKILAWGALPAQVTMTQAWGLGFGGGWNYPSWSISAEWFAYLSFPAFACAAIRMWDRPLMAVGLALLALVSVATAFKAATGSLLTHATTDWGALRIVPSFALGSALWLVWRSDLIRSRLAAAIVLVLSLAGLAVAITCNWHDSLSIAACGGIILGCAVLSKAGSTLLSNRVSVYLGDVSFAVYMVSIPWQLVVGEGLKRFGHIHGSGLPLPLWLVMIVTVVPAGMAAHHLIERPARDHLRKIARRFMAARPRALASEI